MNFASAGGDLDVEMRHAVEIAALDDLRHAVDMARHHVPAQFVADPQANARG